MNVNKKLLLLLLVLTGTFACEQEDASYKDKVTDPELFRRAVNNLTDVIVYDIFSPPVASRIYAYPSIAAYEVLISGSDKYESFAGQLTDLGPVPSPETDNISLEVAAIEAYTLVGKALIFSESMLETSYENLLNQIKESGISSSRMKESQKYGAKVAAHILEWSKKDSYHQTRTFPKYTITEEEGAWKPTPPDYMEGIEPHWNKIRPFVIDSSNQFTPIPPTLYDMDKNSLFFKELMEVYTVGNNLNEEETEIASFWDCNPYVSHHIGHAMYATKKITPGGHWIGITAIATRQANADLVTTVEAYARVSIALADAFISCWDEKWRSILIRPETVINKFIDEDWKPLLQTPPFPEYTSGHSVISSAAAVTLTELFGETFQFTDTTELAYGLPERSFDSFFAASNEAAISRLYGGIHYRPAIDNGVTQGKALGYFVNQKLKTRKDR